MTALFDDQAVEKYEFSQIDNQIRILNRIYQAFGKGNHAEAAIRISQAGFLPLFSLLANAVDCLQKSYDPSEPRDARGRWSQSHGVQSTNPRPHTVVIDPFCKIVKQLCIVEATESLATSNFGMSFFKALNACMDRHGCLGKA